MNDPLVSIAVNNYNYERYLREAIDSALAQTYPHTEIIVVDDGSTDGSKELIAGYGDRVIPVLKENGGQATAINEGFAASTGEIMIFLDADDVLLPDTVERVVESFRANPGAAKVQFRLQVIDEHGNLAERFMPPAHRRMPNGDLLKHALRFFTYPRPPTSGNAFAAAPLRRIFPIPEEQRELYRISADLYINDLSVTFGSIVSLKGKGGLYRVHGKNLHASVRSLDLPFLKRALLRCSYNRAKQKQLLEESRSVEIGEIGAWDLFFLRDRMIHLKLDPANHPFEDSLVLLCGRGCVSSMIYPDIRWHRRVLYALWFLAMPAAPSPLAETLAQSLLYPQGRKSLPGKLLAGLRKFPWRRVIVNKSAHPRKMGE